MAALKAFVQELLHEIERLKHPKSRRNSSVPPSKDDNRPFKTKSLRASEGNSPGGQKGNEGNTPKMTETPDFVIEHKPQYCNHCGKDITGIEAELTARRQIVDIPPIIPQYTGHRAYRVVCLCGHQTEASFPTGIQAHC